PARCPTFLALSLSMLRPLPCSTLFPYTTLFRSPWTYFDQFEEDDESQTSHFVSLSSDLQLSRKTVVNASAQAGFRNETEKELTDFFELDDQRDPLSQLRREMLEDGNGWNADFRVGITHNFAGMSTGRAGG